MAAYMHGSLAIEERVSHPVTKPVKKTVERKKTMPIQEKLLYLFTIVVCVLVATVIIWRYAQIYEVNTKVQQIEQQLLQLENENKMLRLEVNKLQDPKNLIEAGKQLGLIPAEEASISEVPVFEQITTFDEKLAFKQ